MAESVEQFDADIAANDAVVSDIGAVDGDGLGISTPSGSGPTSEEIAAKPDVAAAFDAAFGQGASTPAPAAADSPQADAPKGTTRKRGQSDEETAEELAGLEGADDADDDVEGLRPDGTPKPVEEDDKVVDDKPTGGSDDDEDAGATLSPLLAMAAKRSGWTDEEVAELHKANPDLASRTFQKLLKSLNDVSAEYGRIGSTPHTDGRDKAPASVVQPQSAQSPRFQGQPAPQGAEGILDQVYGQKLPELKTKFGADFVDEIVAPLLAPVQQLMEANGRLMQDSERQAMEAVGRDVNGFFSGLPNELKSLYGDGGQVTKEQEQAKQALCQLADQIQTGASMRGVQLSVHESLDRANLQFAAEHLSTLERKKITASVQKRSKQLTNRPTQRRKGSAPGGKNSDQDAMDAYSNRLAELDIVV